MKRANSWVFKTVLIIGILIAINGFCRAAITTDLQLNDGGFDSFDHFRSELIIHNEAEPVPNAMIFGIIEVANAYYFWPGFTLDIDSETRTIESGVSTIVFLEFDFPEIDEFIPFGPILFWGAWYLDENEFDYDFDEFWLDPSRKWTPTPSPTAVITTTHTPDPTQTITPMETATATATVMGTATPIPTSTFTMLPTSTSVPTSTSTSIPTSTRTPTHTPAPTFTPTPNPSFPPTFTPTCTPLPISGEVTTNTILGKTSPSACGKYLVTGNILVHSGATLLIEAGVEITFSESTRMTIGTTVSGDSGRLLANGTETEPILMTGITEIPGFWQGIYFPDFAMDDSQLMYCIIEYAGNSFYENITCSASAPIVTHCDLRYGSGAGLGCLNTASPQITGSQIHANTFYGIYCDNASPSVVDCDIYDNGVNGVFVDGTSAPTITNSQIRVNGEDGVFVLESAGSFQISDSVFSSNNGYPIRCFAGDLEGLSNNTYTGNLIQSIYTVGDTITESTTWQTQNIPFLMVGDVTVAGTGGIPAILTIEGNAVLQWDRYYQMTIGSNSTTSLGGLRLEGLPGDPILFTQNPANPIGPGEWRGVRFLNYAVDEQCVIFYTTFENGAYDGGAMITCAAASPVINYCDFINGSGDGVACFQGSSPTILGCYFSGNAVAGIYCTGTGSNPIIKSSTFSAQPFGIASTTGAQPVIGGLADFANNIAGNTSYAVYNDDTAICLDARHNWWGHANGPDDDSAAVDGCLDASNNNDPADNVSNDVNYLNWRSTAVP